MDYPKLRPIEAFPVEVENRQRIYIRDPLNYAKDSLLLSYPTYFIISHFDGRHPTPDGQRHPPVRGIIAPHIDLRVGGLCYAWAYKELVERCDADLFILLGTSHYGMSQLFVATEKDYNTPLGPVKTDREFVRALQESYSGDLFADEILHRTEHSLEFQTLFLRYVFGGKRDFTVVPILVSSFHHMVMSETPPEQDPRVAAFLTALRETIARSGRMVCMVA